MIFWIALSMLVEIFNSMTFVAITATKVCGLILLPYVIRNCRLIFKTKPGKLLAVASGLLVVLGIFFGYIAPWPDVTGQ
ncbi:hypothetical protein HZA26_01020, partial [Candidatus Nomurabacteria bacterium]|nr:hypothetical protein [Candidatus Nomurabacteria bacterium]